MATDTRSYQAAESNDEVTVNKWLTSKVDEVVPHEENCVEFKIMKLGMRSELDQVARDDAKLPSDLYHALSHCPKYSSKKSRQLLFSRFCFALEQLERRRVTKAISQDCLVHQFKVQLSASSEAFLNSIPQTDPEWPLFQLHQCLVRVCIRLERSRSASIQGRLIAHCSHLCGMSSKNSKTAVDLIMKLLDMEKITAEDQTCLLEGLLVVEAQNCIDIIQEFRESTGLTKVDMADLAAQIETHSPDYETEDMPVGTIVTTSGTDKNGGGQEVSVRGPPHTDQSATSGVAAQKSFTCPVVSFAITCCSLMLLGLCGAVVLIGMTVTDGFFKNPEPQIILYYGNSSRAVILTEVNQMFTKSVHVTEDVHSGEDAERKIHLYSTRYNIGCSNVPRSSYSKHTEKGDTVSSLNGRVLYLLEGSVLNLTICCNVTNNTNPTFIRMYLFDDLNLARNFNGKVEKKQQLPYFASRSFYCSINKTCRVSSYVTNVTKNSYYSIKFSTLNGLLRSNYSLTLIDSHIDTSSGSIFKKHTLRRNRDSYTFEFKNSAKKSCLIANITTSPGNDSDYVHLHLDFDPVLSPDIGFSIGILAFGVMLILLALYLSILGISCRKNNEYSLLRREAADPES